MKLSEKLRKGIELSPIQLTGEYVEVIFPVIDVIEVDTRYSCAIGAIGIAHLGHPMKGEDHAEYLVKVIRCGKEQVINAGLIPSDIHHKNDGKDGPKWTREQIADWLEEQGL